MNDLTQGWPRYRTQTLAHLVHGSLNQPYLDDLLADIGVRLNADGVPVERITVHVRVLHPQFMGATLTWRPGMREAALQLLQHDVLNTEAFLQSPIRRLFTDSDMIRCRLDDPVERASFPIAGDLWAEGYTDYVGLALPFNDSKRQAVTFATRQPEGFSEEQLAILTELVPIMAMTFELRLNRRLAKNLLNTYVGERAGARVLAGEISRGAGERIQAAIWYSDLRDFTHFAENSPLEEVIVALNDVFDIMGEAVRSRGGEILKFMGDGVLAVFPVDEPMAHCRAVDAALDAARRVRAFNAAREHAGLARLEFSVALHAGEVLYGNIGTSDRLDFTVIGPAVNMTARIERLCRDLGHAVLVSGLFADSCTRSLRPVGEYRLRGVSAPVRLLTPTALYEGALEEEEAQDGAESAGMS